MEREMVHIFMLYQPPERQSLSLSLSLSRFQSIHDIIPAG